MGASSAFAAPPADLVELGQKLAAFPATRGQGTESERFRKLTDLFWAVRMREAPEFATAVGYPGLNDRWTDRSPEALALVKTLSREEQAAIGSIDRERLSAGEKDDYELALRRVELDVEGEKFPGEYLLINQMQGIQLDVVSTLASMPARTVADFETILARLRALPKVIDQTIALLTEGEKKGITPAQVSLSEVPGQVQGLVTGDPFASPLLGPFKRLPESLPAAERERLRGEAAQVYRTTAAPAFQKLHDFLVKVYVPNARQSIAMGDLPNGQAWYAYQAKFYTTTDLTPGAIHELGLAEVKRIRAQMDELIAATGFKGSFADFLHFLRTDPRFFFDKPEELLTGYRDIAKRIDPELIKLFGKLPRLPYGVTAMPAFSEKSAPTALYDNGSLANGQPGWFYANTYDLKSRPRWEMEALTLHEAVPGHHLQSSLAEEIQGLPDWRKWDFNTAYVEGWGLYAESLGGELGLYQDPYSKFGQLTYEVWRAVRLVVDTGIHSMGWTRQQAVDYFKANAAKTDHDIEVEVNRYIGVPGQALAYKLGELKIKELRAYAQKELGARFDIRAFHDRILNHGCVPMGFLEADVKHWVAEVKSGGGKE
ncbi:MAG TPA: DUF885 domain-containing protein [Thermoanaerobaculia bacterium]|nr:DUF885 domain-containing protein [Thermoanaerobaculia bacterium]